jgi:hypothetical protein
VTYNNKLIIYMSWQNISCCFILFSHWFFLNPTNREFQNAILFMLCFSPLDLLTLVICKWECTNVHQFNSSSSKLFIVLQFTPWTLNIFQPLKYNQKFESMEESQNQPLSSEVWNMCTIKNHKIRWPWEKYIWYKVHTRDDLANNKTFMNLAKQCNYPFWNQKVNGHIL